MTSVMAAVRKGDFLAAVDLEDACFQICGHLTFRLFLWFILEGKVIQFKVLCFGLLIALMVFTSLPSCVLDLPTIIF